MWNGSRDNAHGRHIWGQSKKHVCCGSHVSRSPPPSCRAVEKRGLGGHGEAVLPERPTAPGLLGDKWWISKEARKQVLTQPVCWSQGCRWDWTPSGAPASDWTSL